MLLSSTSSSHTAHHHHVEEEALTICTFTLVFIQLSLASVFICPFRPTAPPTHPSQLYYYFHKLYKNNNRIALRTDRAKPGEQSDTESELSSMARVIHYAGGHLFAKQFSEALLGPLGDRLLGQTQPLHQRVQFWPVRI